MFIQAQRAFNQAWQEAYNRGDDYCFFTPERRDWLTPTIYLYRWFKDCSHDVGQDIYFLSSDEVYPWIDHAMDWAEGPTRWEIWTKEQYESFVNAVRESEAY